MAAASSRISALTCDSQVRAYQTLLLSSTASRASVQVSVGVSFTRVRLVEATIDQAVPGVTTDTSKVPSRLSTKVITEIGARSYAALRPATISTAVASTSDVKVKIVPLMVTV